MIPLRVDHAQTIGIVLVVPVVAVALLGAVGPAVLAAASASVAYGFFLTAPYQELAIHDSDDVVAAVTLGAVGLTTGFVSSRLARLAMRDAVRRSELRHLVEYVQAVTERLDHQQLVDLTCASLAALLNLRACHWHPRYQADVGPMLLPDGNIMGYVSSLNVDRSILPAHLEVPAVADAVELGRFVLSPRQDHVASYEERLTAATIVSLFATVSLRSNGD